MSEALGVLHEWRAARLPQIQTQLCRVRMHDGRAMSHLSNVLTRIRLVRRSRIRTFAPAVDLGIVMEI
jgi:hypothetical protein